MKKLISLSIIIMLMLMCLSSAVYAQPKCTVSLLSSTSDYKRGDTVTVDVKLSGIVTENGIIGIEAILNYEKSMLTLESMKRTKWLE